MEKVIHVIWVERINLLVQYHDIIKRRFISLFQFIHIQILVFNWLLRFCEHLSHYFFYLRMKNLDVIHHVFITSGGGFVIKLFLNFFITTRWRSCARTWMLDLFERRLLKRLHLILNLLSNFFQHTFRKFFNHLFLSYQL